MKIKWPTHWLSCKIELSCRFYLKNYLSFDRFGGSSNDVRQTECSQPMYEPPISQSSSTPWKRPTDHDNPSQPKSTIESLDSKEDVASSLERLREILDQV
jgi:hypothetical protein